jgi:hypothetical protein
MGPDGAFIIGRDFLMDGGVTAAYWFGELKPEWTDGQAVGTRVTPAAGRHDAQGRPGRNDLDQAEAGAPQEVLKLLTCALQGPLLNHHI